MQHDEASICNIHTQLMSSIKEARTCVYKVDSSGIQHCVEQVGVCTNPLEVGCRITRQVPVFTSQNAEVCSMMSSQTVSVQD